MELAAQPNSPCRCIQVEGLLDRQVGTVPVVQCIVEQFERLGYQSWAQRILSTAGGLLKHHHIIILLNRLRSGMPCLPSHANRHVPAVTHALGALRGEQS